MTNTINLITQSELDLILEIYDGKCKLSSYSVELFFHSLANRYESLCTHDDSKKELISLGTIDIASLYQCTECKKTLSIHDYETRVGP